VSPRILRFTPLALLLALPMHAQQVTLPLPIDLRHSAEARWLAKPVLARRVLDDLSQPGTWQFSGTGTMTFDTVRASGDCAIAWK